MNKTFLNEICSYNGSKKNLESFIKHKLFYYRSKRNYDFGSLEHNFVSGLSPSISRKIITELEIISEVKKVNLNLVEKFIDEICWRTYWKGFLEHHPKIWSDYLNDFDKLSDLNSINYKNAINGKTKINCFNNWINELKDKGYLHNHTRMWFASIWIFHLKLPWQLGAHFFLKHLLDADSASNTLSWRWVAGLHTSGKFYHASKKNILKYTSNKADTSGLNQKYHNPISDKRFYKPSKIKYPIETIKKESKAHGIIIHEEDLSKPKFGKKDFIIIQKSHFDPYNQSKKIRDFTNKSLKSFENNYFKIDGLNISYFNWDKPKDLKRWKEKNNLKSISISYPCIGKLKNPIKSAQKFLNMSFNYYMNDWDRLAWPFCNSGFFKLKKNIKPFIKNL